MDRVTPDPAHVQHNIETLAAIGGLYDLIAARVEDDHSDILRQYRLDTGAKSLVELLQDRGDQPEHQHTETE